MARGPRCSGILVSSSPSAHLVILAWRSSMMLNLMPFPLGKEIHGLVPLPMTKTFCKRVANVCPTESFMCTISMCDNANTSLAVAAANHHGVPNLKLHVIQDL